MIKVDNIETFNFEGALRGMRNPLASWDQSDSRWVFNYVDEYIIGEKDLALALKLIKAGSDHSKFMRQIFISMDITAPLYWWKEFDTYKVGTVSNSTSTMHTIHKTEITPELFSVEKLDKDSHEIFSDYCYYLEHLRSEYIKTKDKDIWDQLIQMLSSSFNQTRTVTLNYAVASNIYPSREFHKLSEWREFCKVIDSLPYSQLITGKETDD